MPGWLLTGMAGRMQATSTTIRLWVDAHGTDCRLIMMDDIGEVVGVGRRSRFARGWLRDGPPGSQGFRREAGGRRFQHN